MLPSMQFGLVLAAIAVIFIVSLALMVRTVSRPALGLALRLNED
jgi:hypothetical protein